MNFTQKQLEIIKEHTPDALIGKSVSLYSTLGYCMPRGANWSYHVGYVVYKGIFVLVVTLFGKVLG